MHLGPCLPILKRIDSLLLETLGQAPFWAPPIFLPPFLLTIPGGGGVLYILLDLEQRVCEVSFT